MSIFRTNQICAIAALACLTLAGGLATASPVCDTSGSGNPYICVDKSGLDAEEGTDFTFDFSDAANPDVTLKVGNDAWVVYSQASSSDTTPANIGDITIDPTVLSDDFEISIINGAGDGAEDVGSIVLNVASFTGYSSIEGGVINGDLTGNIEVVKDSGGTGGELDLHIEGNADGNVTADTLVKLNIDGDATGDITATDSDANGMGLHIEGDASGTIDIENYDSEVFRVNGDFSGSIDLEAFGDSIGDQFLLKGAVSGTIDIADVTSSGVQLGFNDNLGLNAFSGTLILGDGVESSVNVVVLGDFTSTATINLTNDAVVGFIELSQGGAGTISNGGAVSGAVNLTSSPNETFSGSATFSSVSSGGTVRTLQSGNLSGSVTISGAVAGDIAVDGATSGDIIVGGTLNAQIVISDSLTSTGSITVGGDMQSDIVISLDCAGDIILNGHLSGDVDITGDLTSTGSIVIDDSIKSTGRILVGGLIDGLVSVGTETVTLSQIRAIDGVGSGGCIIIINADEGAYDANGINLHLTRIEPIDV